MSDKDNLSWINNRYLGKANDAEEHARQEHFECAVYDVIAGVEPEPRRAGLIDTPARVRKAWQFMCSGYDKRASDVLKTFDDGAEGVDEMVVVKDIPFYSNCEHHMLPFFGTCTIAYIPDGRIVGLSKLSRLTDIFARRLQVQERMTNQIANALDEHLQPLGCGVVVQARHACMEARGVCQQGHKTITSALRGCFKTEAQTRAEFLSLARCC